MAQGGGELAQEAGEGVDQIVVSNMTSAECTCVISCITRFFYVSNGDSNPSTYMFNTVLLSGNYQWFRIYVTYEHFQ
jgi:hypothetical protein